MGKSGEGGIIRALGLMSGTSMDGIDVAMIETDGDMLVRRGPGMTVPYGADDRQLILKAIEAAPAIKVRSDRPEPLAIAEDRITQLHAAAISEFLAKHAIEPSSIGVVGFHGQTVLHRTDVRILSLVTAPGAIAPTQIPELIPIDQITTVQLGHGSELAKATGIPVVYDMRAADTHAGGQGAPLVPVYHQALVSKLPQRPIAVVNIGGVANVTYIGREGQLLAFDTGPGNALIDDWMMRRANKTCDFDGATAARGTADDEVVRNLLREDYFSNTPPKSLDRNQFSWRAVEWMNLENGAATLTRFTSESIAAARQHFPEQPELWIICGGGRKNRTLMTMLAGRVENAVVPAEAAGLDGDTIEAEAWAYLAVRSLKGWPLTFPGTTGVPRPQPGGVLAKP